MESNGFLYLTNDENILLDTSYRYKICLPEFQYIIKKGTKITIFTNIELFCKQLLIDNLTLILHYLGKKLSSRIKTINNGNNIQHYLQGYFSET